MEYYTAIKKRGLELVWLMSIIRCFVNEARKGEEPYLCVYLTKSLQDSTVCSVGSKANTAAAAGSEQNIIQRWEEMGSAEAGAERAFQRVWCL